MRSTCDSKLSSGERNALEGVVRQRKAAGLVVRRANALLLLDDGWEAAGVARALYLDKETVRDWRRQFAGRGLDFLGLRDYSTRQGHLTFAQETELKAHLADAPVRDTNEVRRHIAGRYGQDFSRSGAIKLMHRLGFVYRKPAKLPAIADEAAQAAFIAEYEALRTALWADETIVFADAVHPEYQSRPAHGWFLKDTKPALKTTSGRKRLNIHGALDLETFSFQFVEAEKITAKTTRQLLQKVETAHPSMRVIHVYVDNARYHHAKALQDWLNAPERRVKLHFLPAYAPHLNPIEPLWGVMHEHVTHNQFHTSFDDFTEAILTFFRQILPNQWREFRDTITDNFRVISHDGYRLIQ